jgi:dTDP-4-dehydrorhamnose 3,5-epimerase
MEIIRTAMPEVLLIKPRVFEDDRGYFFEGHNEREFEARTGMAERFVQDNYSRSRKNVLRGLHYQKPQPQGKLIRLLAGEIYDVAVDIRRGTANFGKWVGIRVCAESRLSVWIPAGFAHGYLVLSDYADVCYKTTDYYAPQHEHCIRWDDPQLAIDWPLSGSPELSAKDEHGKSLEDAELFP